MITGGLFHQTNETKYIDDKSDNEDLQWSTCEQALSWIIDILYVLLLHLICSTRTAQIQEYLLLCPFKLFSIQKPKEMPTVVLCSGSDFLLSKRAESRMKPIKTIVHRDQRLCLKDLILNSLNGITYIGIGMQTPVESPSFYVTSTISFKMWQITTSHKKSSLCCNNRDQNNPRGKEGFNKV